MTQTTVSTWQEVLQRLKQLPEDEEDYGVVLKKVGMVLLSSKGGASGPLYGTAYMKAGAAVKGKTSITLEMQRQC